MKKKAGLFLILCAAFFPACSTVNFSANYYTPPANYQSEIAQMWHNLNSQLKLKNTYDVRIVDGEDAARTRGIPFISEKTVYLPNDFLKYVYQNYYDDRFKILTSTVTHEVCHREFNLPSTPPEEHFKTDLMAIKLLGSNKETAQYFYNSLFVVKNYWFARKGMGGHALNAGWNLASGASMYFGGPTFFKDLYATDLSRRMKLLSKVFNLTSKQCFHRTHEASKQ